MCIDHKTQKFSNTLTRSQITTRVDNPGNSIGGHRFSTAVPSVATSVAVTVFAVATGGPPVDKGGNSLKFHSKYYKNSDASLQSIAWQSYILPLDYLSWHFVCFHWAIFALQHCLHNGFRTRGSENLSKCYPGLLKYLNIKSHEPNI